MSLADVSYTSPGGARREFTASTPSPAAVAAVAPTVESRYCFCEKPSFGEMIKCDDTLCKREWYELLLLLFVSAAMALTVFAAVRFHFSCVGLSQKPSGVWYCRDCRERRGDALDNLEAK